MEEVLHLYICVHCLSKFLIIRRHVTDENCIYSFETFYNSFRTFWGEAQRETQLAKQLIDASRDQKVGLFLEQRISIAIQRANAIWKRYQ